MEFPRNLHVAVKLDLVSVNRALELRVVNLAVLCSGEIVAALFQSELLLADAARILDSDSPRPLNRRGSAGRNDRILVVIQAS